MMLQKMMKIESKVGVSVDAEEVNAAEVGGGRGI